MDQDIGFRRRMKVGQNRGTKNSDYGVISHYIRFHSYFHRVDFDPERTEEVRKPKIYSVRMLQTPVEKKI